MSNRDRDPGEWSAALRLDVSAVVNELDPEGLLDVGTPRDEYASEIGRLVSLIVTGDLSESAILAVWERAFGPGSNLSRRADVLTSLTSGLQRVHDERPSP